MKKKLLMVIMTLVLCISFASCGGNNIDGSSDKESGIDPDATVTKEQYIELKESEWYELTPEEMEKFLGVKYVEDEEGTKDWGEGYLVVDFPGPDEESYVHVLFKEDEKDGKLYPSSLSATGKLMN